MIKELLTFPPATTLHDKSKEVKTFGVRLAALIGDMWDTLDESRKVKDTLGLSAPQIGKNQRVVIIFILGERKTLVNPIIRKRSGLRWSSEECLSLPGQRYMVRRSKRVKVSAFDGNGKRVKFSAADLEAAVIEHEIDHLNGILLTEREKIRE